MMKSKHAICLIAGIFLIMAVVEPVSADAIITTETKVFFEKDGQPYNEPVKYTLKCYGYIIDSTDPNYSNYWRGSYQKKDPGTYNTTEVFSYSATISGYGAKIYEPYYFKYLAFDYCTLYGETNGKKFVIENAGESPISNCSYRDRVVRTPSRYIDVCYFQSNQSNRCLFEQQNSELCNRYLKKYDPNKIYLENLGTTSIDGETMIRTEEYIECSKVARSLDYINCSRYFEEVPCEDYCDPEGHPVQRDCNLYFTIPTDDTGNIIEIPEKEKDSSTVFIGYTGTEENQSIFTIILKFLGLR